MIRAEDRFAEDRLKDAFKGAVETVRTDELRPLTASAHKRLPGRVWAPGLVAACVVLIMVACIAIFGRLGGVGADRAVLGGALRHLIAVDFDGRASVVDAATGRIASVIPARKGAYRAVAGTAESGTFVLMAATSDDAVVPYVVTLSSDGVASRPKEIPGGPVSPANMDPNMRGSAALSPDGSTLALAGVRNGTATVTTVDVRSGRRRAWSASLTAAAVDSPSAIRSVAWSPDNRTLGFVLEDGSMDGREASARLRLLDTKQQERDLLASRPLRHWTIRQGHLRNGRIDQFLFNPDGRTLSVLLEGAGVRTDDADYHLTGLSIRTGEPIGKVIDLPTTLVVKADGTGRHFLVVADRGTGLARIDGDKVSPIGRGADRSYADAAW
ncbi:hypothetical protein ACGFNU_47145 [Spirillospora sp. NPDC048911]|uniref:hypothetical protein n=1 Tax=Spirillospora sp. NPDC048911 TaxID=3364527 RepID=UPI003723F730